MRILERGSQKRRPKSSVQMVSSRLPISELEGQFFAFALKKGLEWDVQTCSIRQ